jgi:hypothetical protein
MGYKLRTVGYNVTITPHPPLIYKGRSEESINKDYAGNARDIAKEIHRYIDCMSIDSEPEREAVCEHCGEPWKQDAQGFNCCCDADSKEVEAAHAAMSFEELRKRVDETDKRISQAEEDRDYWQGLLSKHLATKALDAIDVGATPAEAVEMMKAS